MHGVEGHATEFSSAVRDPFVGYLTGPSLRALPIDARLAAQAIEPARQKQCGYVLLTTATPKRNDGGSFGRALGRALGRG